MEAQETEKKQYRIETLLLCIFPVIGVITFFVIEKGIGKFFVSKDFFIQASFAVFLSCLFALFIRQDRFLKKHGRITNAYFLGSYALSFFWLGLSAAEHTGFFWFLLFLYLALEGEMRAAAAAEFFLMTEYALLGITSSVGMKQFVCYFILANFSIFLFSKLKTLKEIPFLFVILLATDGALSLYATGFRLFEKPDVNQISSQIISIFALTAVGALHVRFLKKKKKIFLPTVQKSGQLLTIQTADAVKAEERNAFEQEKIKIEEQKSAIEKEKTEFEEQKSAIEKEKTEFEEQKSAIEKEKTEFEEQKSAIEKEKTEFEEQKSVIEKEKVILEGQKSEVEQNQSVLKQEKAILEQERTSFEEEKAILEQEKTSFEQEKADLEQEKTSFEQEKVSLEQEKTSFEQEKVSLEQEKIAFEKEKIFLEQEKTAFEQEQSAFDEEKASFEQQKSAPETEQTMLQRVLELTFSLSLRLRDFSAALYEHSQKISTLSGQAAEVVGADMLLARAGGLYHEIGRITAEQDYIPAGERLGKEAGFGDNLLAILRQHNPTNEVPDSPEALVVMLSDSIITSGDFLRKNGQRELVSDEMLVKNIFMKRREQGSLSKAGLSVEQLKKLETFYIEHIAEIESM